MNPQSKADAFQNLISIADRLLGPDGCPWDLEQTFFTLEPYLLEETHELIEAIDLKDPSKIMEELGDVFYALVFIAKLGEKEGTFTLAESITSVADKLVRRHPHIFADAKITSTDDVVKNWEEVKKKEGKRTPIDNIPPTLPSLSRAQKVIHKMRRHGSYVSQEKNSDDIGQKLWNIVSEAESRGIDAESALRRISLEIEEKFKRSAE